jgi:hypothetical protein
MAKELTGLTAVMADMKTKRYSCDPNMGFVQQLQDLEAQGFIVSDMAGQATSPEEAA